MKLKPANATARNRKLSIKLSLIALCVLGGGALSAEESVKLEQSIISATGYEQDIKDAPASISVITSEEIMSRPTRDLGDIVSEVPGVSTSVSKTGANTISVRGMASKYTLILVDGKRINMDPGFDGNGFDSTSGFIPPASMIDRVEVIRGPASLVYGSKAMGGVINIITKKGGDKATGSIGLETRLQEHGNMWGNIYGLNGNIFAPIDEKLSFNIRGKYQYGEKNRFYKSDIAGFNIAGQSATAMANPYTSHSPTGYINTGIGGRLNYTLNEANSFYFDVDYGYQRLGSLNTSSSSVTAVREYHKYNYILNHDGDYEWGKINNYLQYSDTKRYSHTNVDIGSSSGKVNRSSLINNQFYAYGTTLTKNFDFSKYGSMIFQAGPYLEFERLFRRTDGFDKDAYQAAVFAEGEYFINDFVSTTAGARYNYIETYGSFFNPRIYVNTYPSSWLTLKVGVTNGMAAPVLGQRYDGYYSTNGTIDLYGNSDLEVEKTWNYELSAIAETSFATFTLTGFLTEFSDAINSQSYQSGETLPSSYGVCGANGGATCSIYENVDKARTQGVEFAIQSKALFDKFIPRGIYVDFNYAFTDTEQRSGANAGKALNDVPKHNLSTKISYKNWGFDTYVRWIAKIDTPTDNAHSANVGPGAYYKDTHIVDLGTNYRFKNGISIGAVINNLLDKDFVDYSVYQTARGQSYTNNYQRMIPRRNFWLTLRADF